MATGCSQPSGRRARSRGPGRFQRGTLAPAKTLARRRYARCWRRRASADGSSRSSAMSVTCTRGAASASSRSSASSFSGTAVADSATCPPRRRTRSTRRGGCRSKRPRNCSRTAASGRWLSVPWILSRTEPYDSPTFASDVTDAMYALNFYSPVVADQLRSGRKSATIRLGDKSGKYKKGMVVQVLCGVRFGARERVFEAVIDKVEVKSLSELSPREIEHDNPEIRHTEEMANFLGQLYNREIGADEIVTVI